ncbi:MAG TPA: hypothetical protein VHG32_05655 [Thermoanaerobaculia bacterium]|jgi:hypothetical protein|nr:hypothetical protein [Thermoanaerobaculia bacterium]
MLPRTATTLRWRRLWLAAGAALSVFYAVQVFRGGFQHGGSPAGIAYGTAGLAAILVLLYFGVRKRSYRSTWGTLDGWLQSHIYLGILSAFVILFHTGFRFQDRVAVAAYATLLVVVGSGFVGASLYSSVPRRLSEVESDLTPADLAAQIKQLADAMARVAGSRSAPFQQVCKGLLAESLPGVLAGWRVLLSRSSTGLKRRAAAGAAGAGGSGSGAAPWAVYLTQVPAGEQDELRQLLVLSRQRGELLERLVAQQRYRNVLGAWLYLHVPLSVVLLVLVAAHLVAVFYYARP